MHYRKEIDGLRAVAVLAVILFHAGVGAFSGGFVGVDVFFVISGYLITTLIMHDIEREAFSLLYFYERRCRRILPALFFMMLCTLPFAWFWMLPQDLKSFSQSLVAVPAFASNLLFWSTSGYFAPTSELKPLLHTWSLAVEEQYYIVFPLVMMLAYACCKRWIVPLLIIAAMMSLAAAQWASSAHPSAAFYLLPTRGFELLMGALIAFYMKRETRIAPVRLYRAQLASIAGLLLIMYAVMMFDKSTPTPSLYTLIPTMGAGLIIIYARRDTLVGGLLSTKAAVFVGLISYSAYLWHQPLFAFARLKSTDAPSSALMGALALLSLVLGYASWKYIETPFRDKQKIARRYVFMGAVASSVFFMAIGVYGHHHKGFAQRMSSAILQAAEIAPSNAILAKTEQCSNELGADLKGCVWGDTSKQPTYALFGDSHAETLVYALSQSFAKRNLSFVQYTKSACPSLYLATKHDGQAFGQCEVFTQRVREDIKKRGIHKTIMHARWRWYLAGEAFDNGQGGHEKPDSKVQTGSSAANISYANTPYLLYAFSRTLDELTRTGEVILIYDTPEIGWDVPARFAKLKNNDAAASVNISISAQYMKQKVHEIESFFDAYASAHRRRIKTVKPKHIFCDTYIRGGCAAVANDVIFYRDDDHLSNAGAQLIVNEVMKAVK